MPNNGTYCGGSTDAGGVVGVSAKDGQVLWKTDEWKVRTNVPMPLMVGADRIFLTAGYGQYDSGCMMLRLTESDGKITAQSEFKHPTTVFGSMQHTPIFYNDHIYGVGMDKQLVCLDLEGKVVWTSTSANTFGSGPYVIADGMLYVLERLRRPDARRGRRLRIRPVGPGQGPGWNRILGADRRRLRQADRAGPDPHGLPGRRRACDGLRS